MELHSLRFGPRPKPRGVLLELLSETLLPKGRTIPFPERNPAPAARVQGISIPCTVGVPRVYERGRVNPASASTPRIESIAFLLNKLTADRKHM
jgi:hypothetical protein